MGITITSANYEQEVIRSSLPVVIDVFATWCGPCQLMKPVFADIEKRFSDTYKLVTLNVDEDRELSGKLGVTSVPTFLFFNKGKLVAKEVGVMGAEAFIKLMEAHFKG